MMSASRKLFGIDPAVDDPRCGRQPREPADSGEKRAGLKSPAAWAWTAAARCPTVAEDCCGRPSRPALDEGVVPLGAVACTRLARSSTWRPSQFGGRTVFFNGQAEGRTARQTVDSGRGEGVRSSASVRSVRRNQIGHGRCGSSMPRRPCRWTRVPPRPSFAPYRLSRAASRPAHGGRNRRHIAGRPSRLGRCRRARQWRLWMGHPGRHASVLLRCAQNVRRPPQVVQGLFGLGAAIPSTGL